jgi:tellurite resistance protein
MSLAVLVRRFGDLLNDQPPPSASYAEPYEDFPEKLTRLRATLNHHLIALLTLARCDGELAAVEREAILTYCQEYLADIGMTTTPDERAALEQYVRVFKPARPQLALALKRLETEPKAHIAGLIAAAQAVADADGVRRAYEVKILGEIAKDLAALPNNAQS